MAGWKRRRLDKALLDVGIIECERAAGMIEGMQGEWRLEKVEGLEGLEAGMRVKVGGSVAGGKKKR